MRNFQITRLQLFEMINELFADTVVICNHEKLFIKTGYKSIEIRASGPMG